MKNPWVTLVAVLLGGFGVGAAIVGLPATPVNDVQIFALPPTTTSTSTTVVPAAPTTTAPARVITTTTAKTVPTTTTTTVGTTTTTAATTTTTTTTPAPNRANVSVLVANAGNEKGIARAEATHLIALGYTKPLTDDAVKISNQTVVYARSGHEADALQLLADAGLSSDRLRPFPSAAAPITTLDGNVDLILALGNDWAA